MAAGQKKVIIRTLNNAVFSGYLPGGEVGSGAEIELIDPSGRVIKLLISDIKMISYVKDFNLDDADDPERIGRRTFLGRPRGEGLWLKVTFTDSGFIEGLCGSGMVFIDSLIRDRGLFLSPPDGRANSQRIFIPRSAMAHAEFVAVMTTAAKRKAMEKPATERQPTLFEDR